MDAVNESPKIGISCEAKKAMEKFIAALREGKSSAEITTAQAIKPEASNQFGLGAVPQKKEGVVV